MIPNGGRALPGVVVGNPAVPGRAGVYYTFRPLASGGTETEGTAGTLAVTGIFQTGLVLPDGSPAVFSEDLQWEWAGTRWVAEKFGVGGGGHFIPGCACELIPDTLTMNVSKPDSNSHIFHNCTIQYYSPVPAQFSSLALGSFAYLSTASFTDDFSTSPFWYYFTCSAGYYVLSRAYPRTATSPAHLDSVRYKWLAGFPGNTCSPFSLTNGLIFTGGDPSCVVTVSG